MTMPRPVANLTLTLHDVPMKIFVKQTSEFNAETKEQKKFELPFQGTEAKLAYEEIISLESQKKSAPNRTEQCSSAISIPKSETNTSASDNVVVININTLFKAVESGDKDFISKHFHSGNVNIIDQFGWTPLMSAAYAGHIEIVNILLKFGANTRVRDRSGYSAIDLASRRNNIDVINLLKSKFNKKQKTEKNENCIEHEIEHDERAVNNNPFYCDVCKIIFKESSRKKHETSTLHIFNSKPKLSNAFYGIPKQNKGYQMLLNTGWNEEGGLGPTGEGQKYPVKTILKRDREGLGKSEKNIARVTHFNPHDRNAIRSIHKSKSKITKLRDHKKQLSRDAAKTRALRQALS